MQIFGSVIQGLGVALELLQTRHEVLTENVANAETPGYRARDLDFADALADAFDPARAGHGGGGALEPIVDRAAAVKIDRNSVDLDTEMARLSENAFSIVALSQVLARKYQALKFAIEEGRR